MSKPPDSALTGAVGDVPRLLVAHRPIGHTTGRLLSGRSHPSKDLGYRTGREGAGDTGPTHRQDSLALTELRPGDLRCHCREQGWRCRRSSCRRETEEGRDSPTICSGVHLMVSGPHDL